MCSMNMLYIETYMLWCFNVNMFCTKTYILKKEKNIYSIDIWNICKLIYELLAKSSIFIFAMIKGENFTISLKKNAWKQGETLQNFKNSYILSDLDIQWQILQIALILWKYFWNIAYIGWYMQFQWSMFCHHQKEEDCWLLWWFWW